MKIYSIYDNYKKENIGIGFMKREDAEEFLLSVAQEGAFEWFCDYLYGDYWHLGTPEAVFAKWEELQKEWDNTNYSIPCYALIVGLYELIINEIEVY